jgi:hypothetical protein
VPLILLAWSKQFDEPIEVLQKEYDEYVSEARAIETAIAKVDPLAGDHWPDPVDGEELVKELMGRLRRHLSLTDAQAVVTTFWCLQCWAHNELANFSPILAPVAVESESGRTRTLTLLSFLTPLPFGPSEDVSVAALYTAADRGSTIFLDEQDAVLKKNDSPMARVIKGSWSRPASVNRMGRDWNTFCPKAISVQFASSFSHAMWTRCIFICLRPPLPDEVLEPFLPTLAKSDQQLHDL